MSVSIFIIIYLYEFLYNSNTISCNCCCKCCHPENDINFKSSSNTNTKQNKKEYIFQNRYISTHLEFLGTLIFINKEQNKKGCNKIQNLNLLKLNT